MPNGNITSEHVFPGVGFLLEASHRRRWVWNVPSDMCLEGQAFAKAGAFASSARNVAAFYIDATVLPEKGTFVCGSMARRKDNHAIREDDGKCIHMLMSHCSSV